MAAALDARWNALYTACRPSLYRTAALLVGEGEAEEVVQDAFERAMRQPAFFEQVIDPVAWLRTVTTRAALGRLRRRALWDTARTLLDRSDHGSPDPGRADLVSALGTLPPRQRAAIVLRYYHGSAYAEIASALDIDTESVGPLLSRARAALRDLLR